MNKEKTAFWRYALGTLVFVAIHFLAPALIFLLNRIMDLFTPGYLRVSETENVIWAWFIGYILAAVMNCQATLTIVKENKLFVSVLCFIAAAYSFFVSAWNYAIGLNSLVITLAIIAGGISYLALGITMFNEHSHSKEGN